MNETQSLSGVPSYWHKKHLSKSLNLYIKSGWCMTNLEKLPSNCQNEQMRLDFCDSVDFLLNFAVLKSVTVI